MTREELLKIAKPILFNTDMVQAILDGRKATTRRPCKIKINGVKPVTHELCDIAEYPETNIDGLCANFYDNEHFYKGCAKPPYKVGDYLYVRETWCGIGPVNAHDYIYKADDPLGSDRWHPSIHMPKEAARIFLRVTDVREERLQEITDEQALKEGLASRADFISTFLKIYPNCTEESWVWVIEFERVEVEP